jgi:hypothetical protein
MVSRLKIANVTYRILTYGFFSHIPYANAILNSSVS